MAFSKYAYANIIKPDINIPIWDRVRDSAQALGSAFASRSSSKISLAEFSPKEYMLSHATIVASVDTEKGPGPLGRHLEGGFTIDRAYQDYYVTPKTARFINNNQDCWERKLLLASFRTFIGGENYLEHLQIPEMSKGKIVDAAARDIGDSVYIDILVATHRRHAPLIAAINSRQLQTMSMGANVAFTLCTKCGNKAADETQLCPHVKYEKGNKFLDILGSERRVGELCGHISEEPGSNRFIEASWVGNPAFQGAVLRSILTPEEASVYDRLHSGRLQVAFSTPPKVADDNSFSKVARRAFDFGEEKEEFPGGGQEPSSQEDQPEKPEPEKDPLESLVDDISKTIKDRAIRKLRQDLEGKTPGNEVEEDHTNNNLIPASTRALRPKLARVVKNLTSDLQTQRVLMSGALLHQAGGWKAVSASRNYSGRDVLAISRVLDQLHGSPSVAGMARIYRTVLAVGGAGPYVDVETYLAACSRVLGREPTQTEKLALITKGRLFDLGN
jgi:hypothetical protein